MMRDIGPITLIAGRRYAVRLVRTPRVAYRVDRFTEGDVYHVWLAWLFIKVMVPA